MSMSWILLKLWLVENTKFKSLGFFTIFDIYGMFSGIFAGTG